MSSIVTAAVFVFVILFGAYFVLTWRALDRLEGDERRKFVEARLTRVSTEAWAFARPLLQTAALLLIVLAVLAALNINLAGPPTFLGGDFKALLAATIVGALALAVLANSPSASLLKDLALVVVGFYFGGALTGHT